ncbi:MAG: hypothetical protein ACYTFY_13555 [Planctomycetota bacterium]|jgi:hypothetical protein
MNMKKSIDLSCVQLSQGWERQVSCIDGEETTLIKSFGVSAPLVIPLSKTGIFKIHLGICRPEKRAAEFQVRLSSQKYWRTVVPKNYIFDQGGFLEDAELGPFEVKSDDKLLIRSVSYVHAVIGYIYLEESEIKKLPEEKPSVGAVFDVTIW